MGKLDGKLALITGAGSGIGRATAQLFAEQGAQLVIADYVPEKGHETTRLITQGGGKAVFVEVDVSNAASVEIMFAIVMDKFGRIDVLHNNAGIWRLGNTTNTTEEEWNLLIDTNLKSVFLCTKLAVPIMRAQGNGVVINTSSTSGLMGASANLAYGVSKAGVIQLTKTSALECGKHGIRVNCICPGATETPLGDAIWGG